VILSEKGSLFVVLRLAARNAARIISRVESGILSREEAGRKISTLETMDAAAGGG
jgi:hypothetical protein